MAAEANKGNLHCGIDEILSTLAEFIAAGVASIPIQRRNTPGFLGVFVRFC
jgi:hypothetical protein